MANISLDRMVDLTYYRNIVYPEDEDSSFVSLASLSRDTKDKLIVHTTPHVGRIWIETMSSNAFILHGVLADNHSNMKSHTFQCDGVFQGTVYFTVDMGPASIVRSCPCQYLPAAFVQFHSSLDKKRAIELIACHLISIHPKETFVADTSCAVCFNKIAAGFPFKTLPCFHHACPHCYVQWCEDTETKCRVCVSVVGRI